MDERDGEFDCRMKGPKIDLEDEEIPWSWSWLGVGSFEFMLSSNLVGWKSFLKIVEMLISISKDVLLDMEIFSTLWFFLVWTDFWVWLLDTLQDILGFVTRIHSTHEDNDHPNAKH